VKIPEKGNGKGREGEKDAQRMHDFKLAGDSSQSALQTNPDT
jgi:hypothetical protein